MPELTEDRKRAMSQMEFGGFLKSTGTTKIFLQEQYNYNGSACTIYKAKGDGNADAKAGGVKLAIRTIVDNGFALPAGMRVYCTDDTTAQNRAFHRDPGWRAICWIVLGPTALGTGSTNSISKQDNPGFTPQAVTCIHEIGHNLHEQSAGDLRFFGTGSDLSGQPQNYGEVSGYAGNTKKEFVAEVFAGMMIGRKYSRQVIDEYNSYSGPSNSSFPSGAIA